MNENGVFPRSVCFCKTVSSFIKGIRKTFPENIFEINQERYKDALLQPMPCKSARERVVVATHIICLLARLKIKPHSL